MRVADPHQMPLDVAAPVGWNVARSVNEFTLDQRDAPRANLGDVE
jgi:hypothetical protein